jgi:hypothetical protein
MRGDDDRIEKGFDESIAGVLLSPELVCTPDSCNRKSRSGRLHSQDANSNHRADFPSDVHSSRRKHDDANV